MNKSIPESAESYWIATAPGPHLPALTKDIEVDVAIVGGGITGITAALLLQRAGKRVAILEAHCVGHGVTGKTTAHLTAALDTRYKTLIRDFGLEGASLAAGASRAAIEQIAKLVSERTIDCDWRRVPGYLYTERGEDLEALHAEHDAALRVGLAVDLTTDVPLPFATRGALRFADQAELHPARYLARLCEELLAGGAHIYEETRVVELDDGEPCRLTTASGVVRAAAVIVAANAPLTRFRLQTKIAHYRSYALGVRTRSGAPQLDGLFWDMDDPYHYIRSARGMDGAEPLLIVGGEDHKTGTEKDTYAAYERLLTYTRAHFDVEEVAFRWSGQIIETVDGLPLIGRHSTSSGIYVATGYSGNGMTFGTVAAMILSDAILGRPNPWSDLFDSTRIKPMSAAKDFIAENVDVPLHFVGDRIRPADAKHVGEVGRGEGKIVRVDGKRLAVFRDADGSARALSPVCSHLGCHVRFNDAEKTWDCPCHGSRFDTNGKVLNGPALRDLRAVEITDDASPPVEPNG